MVTLWALLLLLFSQLYYLVFIAQAGSVYQLHGPHSPSTWIITPMPTACVQPQPPEGSAWLDFTALRAAMSPFPALQGFTAMHQVRYSHADQG